MDDLLATPSGWFDQDEDCPGVYDFIYWTLNENVDTDEVSDTFPREKTQRGDEPYVSVVPKDAFASGEAVASSLIVIENTAPTGGGVSRSTPGAPRANRRPPLHGGRDSDDDDGDPIEYTYRWLVDGVETRLTGPVVDNLETSNLEDVDVRSHPHRWHRGGSSFSDSVSVSDGSAPPHPT